MIQVDNLVKFYGEQKILHNVSFSVSEGGICGFLGPNGSGKSTTMDILSGILGPSGGSVFVGGLDVIRKPFHARRIIGYLPDNPPVYLDMRVKEFVDYVARLHGVPFFLRRRLVKSALEECAVEDVQNRIIGNLSKGYIQRVALCAALVHEPEVVLLDEPTEGLDPVQIIHIRELIKTLGKKSTVLVSSHILSEVQATCDDVIIINKGRIVSQTKVLTGDEAFRRPFEVHTLKDRDEAVALLPELPFIESFEVCEFCENGFQVVFKALSSQEEELCSARLNEFLVGKGFQVSHLFRAKTPLEQIFLKAIRGGEMPISGGMDSRPEAPKSNCCACDNLDSNKEES